MESLGLAFGLSLIDWSEVHLSDWGGRGLGFVFFGLVVNLVTSLGSRIREGRSHDGSD